jgi:hypothetical protein
MLLRPEAILCLLVPLKFAELSDFFIGKPPDMHLRECRGATVAFRLNGRERHDDVFFGKEMMNLDGEDAAAKCQGMFEKTDDLIVALVIARQRTVTRHMSGDRCVECLKDRGDVALGEVVVRLANNSSVGRDHGSSITRNLACPKDICSDSTVTSLR